MRPSRPISKRASGCCPGIARPAHRSVILACTVLTYHANGKSETLSVIAPAPCGEPSRRPLGGGAVARATVSLGARSGAGAGRGVELAIDGSSLSPARGVAEGRGAEARSGSANGRSEEHTSELQSLAYLVCRLLLEKKKTKLLVKKEITNPDR